MSITGHKNEQSLRDYTDVDIEDHAKLSGILVGASKSIQKRSPLKDTSNEVKMGHGTSVQNTPGPSTFNFTNCTVYFGNSCNTSSNTQLNQVCTQHSKQVPFRKRAYICH